MLADQPIADFLFSARDVERAGHPVPDRKHEAVVDVDVLRRRSMMALVLRRAAEDPAPEWSEAQPHVRVPRVGEDEEGHVEHVFAGDLERPSRRDEVHHRGLDDADEDALHERASERLDRMIAVVRDRCQDLDRVVDAVKGPQHLDTMHEEVAEEPAEIEGEEGGDGQDRASPEPRRLDWHREHGDDLR